MANDFAGAVTRFIDKTETDSRDALAKICLDVYGGVLRNTRVDTGRLRGSWRMNIGSADTSVAEETDAVSVAEGSSPSGAEISYALGITPQIKLGDVIVISNALPYAEVWNDEDRIIEDTVSEVLENLDELLEEVASA